MSQVHIDPDDEGKPRSQAAIMALRIGAILLGSFLGFTLYVCGYLMATFVDTELLGNQEYILLRLGISVVICTILGLVTPFHLISDIFHHLFGFLQGGSGKSVSIGRLIVLTSIMLAFSFIFWYFLGFLAPPIDSLFSF